MRKKLFMLLLVFALMLGLAACAKPADGGKTEDAGTHDTDKPVEITVAFNAMPNGLDPISEDLNTTISVCSHVYDYIVEMDSNWQWKPSVAKSWKQIDDLNWEFEINLDYTFSNGEKVTMDDVVFSILRLKDIPKSADAASRIADVTYEGTTLKVKLTEANNTTMPAVLWTAIVVNKNYIESGGDEALYTKPIGTGPYVVTEFTPGATVTIEVREDYDFTKPQIDKINFVCIPENANRYIAVESGQMQYAGLVSAHEMQLAKENGKFNLIESLSNRTCTFFFQTEREPFTDANVRRALAHAFDRESFCALNGGRHSILSPLFGGFDDYYYESEYTPEYDLDKARELLEDAGIDPQHPIDIEIVYFLDDPGIELYQSTLKTLGVNAKLSLIEFSVYLTRESPGDFDMIWVGLRNIAGSALMDMERLDSTFIGTRNNSRYVNPEMDEMIQRARVTTDQEELKELIVQMNDLLAQESPFVTAFLQNNYAVMDGKLEGVTIRGDMLQNFRYATYSK